MRFVGKLSQSGRHNSK